MRFRTVLSDFKGSSKLLLEWGRGKLSRIPVPARVKRLAVRLAARAV